MNRFQIYIFILFIFISAQSIAQVQVNIERSSKIETIDGQRFYLHIVKKGQTAYSLSKAYGVRVDDIYKYNPGTDKGLALDQELRIPYRERIIVKPSVSQDSLTSDSSFIFHKVTVGETLYHITKVYNVNQDVLVQYNPDLTSDLHPGDIIKIPTQNKLVSEKAKALYPNIINYKVKRKDNYYRLKNKFAVSQEQLEQLNPQLRKSGLQKGEIILMPSGLKKLDTIPTYVDIFPDTVPTNDSLRVVDTQSLINCDSTWLHNDTFRIALMIPFYSELESEIRTSSAYYSKGANSYKSFRFIQFYEGFLMALDSIKQLGFNAEVYIYDTEGDTATTRMITEKPEFQSLDLVIGPLFHENVKIVLKAGKSNNLKVVSPFSRNMDLVSSCSNLIKLAPNVQSIVQNSCQWVVDSLPHSRIMVLHDGSKNEKEIVELIKESFSIHAGQGIDTNEVFIYSYKDNGSKKLINNLSKDRNNVLINLSNNEAQISNFVRELYSKTEDYNIYLIGSELNWRRFETLEVKYLVSLHLTQCASHFVDHSDTIVEQFETRFIERYKTVPNAYAYNGFDISWFFMNALLNYGVDFEDCMNNLEINNMSTEYHFKQNGEGAYENSYLNIYQYDDFRVVNKKAK
jgi:LysM repeat protein/ABC-type branched-subunit amino acid transport system substrate-binding protein